MNRPIKFRVWDFTIKRFDTEIYQAGEQFGHPSSCDWIAQQYTGLNDKNGKEIYEGDIVQYNQNSSYDNMDFIAKWSDDKLGFIFQSNSGEQLVNQTPHLNRFKHLEVVGNIFEHENLLK
jgi:uncharacterized phage protein (TIGR01671 family)